MKDRNVLIISIFSFACMFGIAGYYMKHLPADSHRHVPTPGITATQKMSPDIIINNITLRNQTPTTLVINMTAAQAAITRKTNIIHCLSLVSNISKNNAPLGTITAQEATLDQEKKIITFFKAEGTLHDSITLKGEKLVYDMATNVLMSADPVEINHTMGSCIATTISFDIEKKQLILEQATTTIAQSYDTLQKH